MLAYSSNASSGRGGGRRGTGEDWIIVVVVEPYKRKLSRLGAAMLVALITITPIGITGAFPAMTQPLLLLAGIGIGICSSVIPYVSDQLAMARLPRATFALLLSLLPASAALIGILVLHQIPTWIEIAGILLVAGRVALHRESEAVPRKPAKSM